MPILRIIRAPKPAPEPSPFPLSISGNGRYLQNAQGDPFIIRGDTPWSLAVQLTNAEITTYLNDCADKDFNLILFNAIEHNFSSQSPAYENVDGDPPFTSMTDFASGLNSSYWARVDHIVNTAKELGIFCLINPAYLGIDGLDEGWDTELTAESAGDLQTYGAALANRYTQGNVGWCPGGDASPGATLRDKQWNIITGIRTVRTTDIITAHGAPGQPSFSTWEGQTGYNLHTAYPGAALDVYDACLTEYARSPTRPVLMLEAIYEQERDPVISAAGLRRQTYQGIHSTPCGDMFGWSPGWHFEAPNAPFSYTGTWESNLDSTGRQQRVHAHALVQAYAWHLLEPQTGTSLVSSSLSSGNTRICPALASDGTFASIWVPSSQTITVVTNALTGVAGNVRIRRFNPTDGTYTVIQASIAKTSAQSVATGAEGCIVVDAA
jgi:hypothetical protein